jgi:hypothetical protein
LRKFVLVAGVAAFFLGATGVAAAQEPTSTVEVKLTPNKAGSKSKPKATKLVLTVNNTLQTQTASELKITAPKQISFSLKDFKKCDADDLQAQGKTACPSGSQVGPTGVAHAKAGVNGNSSATVDFDVTPYAIGSNKIGFYLELAGGSIRGLAVGTFKGRTLTVKIPETPAQQYPAGSYNALIDLTANLWVKSKKSVVKTTGCPSSKKLSFKNTITFVTSDRTADNVLNPTPPDVKTSTASGNATCRK